jgi:hypothetical protein
VVEALDLDLGARGKDPRADGLGEAAEAEVHHGDGLALAAKRLRPHRLRAHGVDALAHPPARGGQERRDADEQCEPPPGGAAGARRSGTLPPP